MDKNTTLPLSVFIITKNEADRIAEAILSVQDLAQEILVVDSGSEDNTVEIAANLGAKTLFNAWEGYGQQKYFAEQQCQYDWILNIDADERVTKSLRQEILDWFAAEQHKKYVGAWINISEIPHYRPYASKGIHNKLYLRLYHKQYCTYRQHTVHDSVVTSHKNLFTFKQNITHRSFRSHAHAIDKMNFYTSCLAEDAHQKGKKVARITLLTIFPLAFIKHYFLESIFYMV